MSSPLLFPENAPPDTQFRPVRRRFGRFGDMKSPKCGLFGTIWDISINTAADGRYIYGNAGENPVKCAVLAVYVAGYFGCPS